MGTPSRRPKLVELRPRLTVVYPVLWRSRAMPGRVHITASLSRITAGQLTMKDALKLLQMFEGRRFRVRANARKGYCLFFLAVPHIQTTRQAKEAAQEFASELTRALHGLGKITAELDPQSPATIQALWEQAA